MRLFKLTVVVLLSFIFVYCETPPETVESEKSTLLALSISPDSATLFKGEKRSFTVSGTYSDNSIKDITGLVTWSSSNSELLTIIDGEAVAIAIGKVDISASLDGFSSSTSVTIIPAELLSIDINPQQTSTLIEGQIQQFFAVGKYNDGSTEDLTNIVVWSSGDSDILKVDNTGLVTAGQEGKVFLTASYELISSSLEVEVKAEQITEVSEETRSPVENESVSDEEMNEARYAVEAAKEAEAKFFDPVTLREAENALKEAELFRSRDVELARKKLEISIQKAKQALKNSIQRKWYQVNIMMDERFEELLENQVDKFAKDEFLQVELAREEARKFAENDDLYKATLDGLEVVKRMQTLRDAIIGKISSVRSIRYTVEQLIDEAQQAKAHIHAANEFSGLNNFYLAGLEALQLYDLDKAELEFGAAKEIGSDAVRIAKSQSSSVVKEQVDELMIEVMKELQEASKLMIITDNGDVIDPEPWDGTQFIESSEVNLDESTSSLFKDEIDILQDRVLVLGDEEEDTLLTQAKELWRIGLKERNLGNYPRALEYFQEAQRYVQAYKSFAVQGIYTVRFIPERRDALWRISEYDFIYDDPYLWPQIWRRNRKLIQNPDLIYPGWQLIIPPR